MTVHPHASQYIPTHNSTSPRITIHPHSWQYIPMHHNTSPRITVHPHSSQYIIMGMRSYSCPASQSDHPTKKYCFLVKLPHKKYSFLVTQTTVLVYFNNSELKAMFLAVKLPLRRKKRNCTIYCHAQKVWTTLLLSFSPTFHWTLHTLMHPAYVDCV